LAVHVLVVLHKKWDLGYIWAARFERMDLVVRDGMAPHGHLIHMNAPCPVDSPGKVVVHNQIGSFVVVGAGHMGDHMEFQQPPGKHMEVREWFACGGGQQQLSFPILGGNYRHHHIHPEKEGEQGKVRDKPLHHIQALNVSWAGAKALVKSIRNSDARG
jgi:hypothetical protein